MGKQRMVRLNDTQNENGPSPKKDKLPGTVIECRAVQAFAA